MSANLWRGSGRRHRRSDLGPPREPQRPPFETITYSGGAPAAEVEHITRSPARIIERDTCRGLGELLDPATLATVAIASMSSAHRAAAAYPEPDAPDEELG
jgi:hypothetical protein